MMEWIKILGLHAAGFMLILFTALGIPGNLSMNTRVLKKLETIFSLSIQVGWAGIPVLVLASILLKIFHLTEYAFFAGYVSVFLGILGFTTLVLIYQVKDRKPER